MILEPLDGKINEKVGKVWLDYTAYSGEDLYCDGEVEDALLDIAKGNSDVEFPRIIEERADWPTFYHLSSARENIVRWLPIKKTDKVLEVGSGCGAITGAFTKLAGKVVSCDLSRKRSMINAYRHMSDENLTIHVGNFLDVEKNLEKDFDLIALIGVFEYGASYINSPKPYEDFLKILKKHLKPEGRIVIAIENRLGLKYFAGAREDHLSEYFVGIEGYEDRDPVRTFSKPALKRIFDSVGLTKQHFYYPYPDYKFMTELYSDKRLPLEGELTNNDRNFDQDRMALFSESKAFDSFIKDKTFDMVSNSFMVVLGPDTNVDYARFSNDRAPQYQIFTTIEEKEGEKVIVKRPLSPEGNAHIENMGASFEKLKTRYEGSQLEINSCEIIRKNPNLEACFKFVKGNTLSYLMDELLRKGDKEGFYKLFSEYVKRVGFNNDFPFSNLDVVFSNILVNKDEWTLIDYEWTKDRKTDISETAYRAFYCFLLEDKKRKPDKERILKLLSLPEEAAALIERDEAVFQKKITGKHLSQGEIRNLLGKKIIDPIKIASKFEDNSQVYRFQVYEGNPDGSFSEENSYFIKDAYLSETEACVSIPVTMKDKIIRLDPLSDACIVTIKEADIDSNPYAVENKKMLLSNGKRIGQDSFIFNTADPNLIFLLEGLVKSEESFLNVKLDIVRLKTDMAEKIFDNIKRIF